MIGESGTGALNFADGDPTPTLFVIFLSSLDFDSSRSLAGADASQGDVFASIRPLIDRAREGFNATLLAYGPTGSGKTYTLQGQIDGSAEEGMILQSIRALLEPDDPSAKCCTHFSLSMVEIYMENLSDLLSDARRNLKMVDDPARGVVVSGAVVAPFASVAEARALLLRGYSNRTVHATLMNAASSRSHCIVTIHVERVDLRGGASPICSKLHLADLAGSERADPAADAITTREGAQINKSLTYVHTSLYLYLFFIFWHCSCEPELPFIRFFPLFCAYGVSFVEGPTHGTHPRSHPRML